MVYLSHLQFILMSLNYKVRSVFKGTSEYKGYCSAMKLLQMASLRMLTRIKNDKTSVTV